ncbi:MAG: Lrp/AsnC family transcriptional regulator [Candidatus Micrarchaeota archaeon]|nr:Lrp/AsnC family transcriptional regulator [Candidatus Micrarchaeota archaeon]
MERIEKPIALVLISRSPHTNSAEIAAKISQISGIKLVYELTGNTDIVAFLHAKRMNPDGNAIVDQIRKVPGVDETDTKVILNEVKRP